MNIAAEICVYTNDALTMELLPDRAEAKDGAA
jgi:ATP-dependent protease HslVU (ClpYQ) peptidase subunit